MVYDPENGTTNIKFRDGRTDTSTIVIATDGGHRAERPGQLGLISSYGVFFGPNSPYNQGALLPFSEKQGSDSAEYYAARVAIEFMRNHTWGEGHCFPVDKIVILTDSAGMVKGLTEYIKKLRESGRMKVTKGIASFDILFNIDRMMREFREQGRQICFWNVPRCYNKNADNLATQGYTQRGSSSFEHTIDRPWKGWALAKILRKTLEERARSEAVMKRITFPLVPQHNECTASITSFLIDRWVLNEDYRKEHPLSKMGGMFGPNYRDVFVQEQVNTETKIGELQHEIMELSKYRHHHLMLQRHQLAELELRLEIYQQVSKKLTMHIASIPKAQRKIFFGPTQAQMLPEKTQAEIPSKTKQGKSKSKKKQPQPVLETTQQSAPVHQRHTISLPVPTKSEPAPKQLLREQRKKQTRKSRKEALGAEKRSGKKHKKK